MAEEVRVIAVSGLPGSGTSTACQLLQERLGWAYLNAGQIFRELAAEAGVSLAEYGRRAEADPRIDRALDVRMVERARQREPVVLEGRLTGWMVLRHGVEALKVWLEAPSRIRADRVARRDGLPLEMALQEMAERERSEQQRYSQFHDLELADLSVYDLVLDTEQHAPEWLVERIVAALGRRQKGG